MIGKGTDAPWDDEGNIVITIKSKDSDGEYGKEYKIKLKGVYSAMPMGNPVLTLKK